MTPRNSSKNDSFVQEYLYIEEYDYEIPKSKSEEEHEKIERGFYIIDLM